MNCTKHPEMNAIGMCTYCGKPFCSECLVEVDGKMVCRDDVTRLLKDVKDEGSKAANVQQPLNIYNTNTNVNTSESMAGGGYGYQLPLKSKMITLLLCIFLGYLGAHRFYLGKTALVSSISSPAA